MGKSTPKAPPAPDPVATANAQAAANTQAAITQAGLNRINQVTPQGTISYAQHGVDANGIPQYTQTMQYSPEQQALYNQQNQTAQQLGSLALNNIDRVRQTQGQAFNYDGMTPLATGVSAGNLQYSTSNPQAQTQVAPAGGIQTTFGNAGPVNRAVDALGNFSQNGGAGLQTRVGGDFNQAAQSAADAAFAQARSRLDPQYEQAQSDMTARLANSGISENSDAYRREMMNFARQRNDAYNQANWSAFGAGLNAQQQGFAQGQANAALNNQAIGQSFTQNLGAAQFGNEAQQQQFGQNQQAAAFGNAAQDQQYQQNLSNAGFYNQAQGQNFAQAQQQAALNNTTQNQAFNQQLSAGAFGNQARQQQIEEATYLRNLPLNDIAALLGTGGGVQQPNFQPFAQVGVAAPDYQGMVMNNYNAQMGQYNQQMQARSQGLGSIFGALGSIGGAVISDRRLKENIKRIGQLANGAATYTYNYLGSKAVEFGVMAQELLAIVPEAVVTGDDGYYRVDYRKVL